MISQSPSPDTALEPGSASPKGRGTPGSLVVVSILLLAVAVAYIASRQGNPQSQQRQAELAMSPEKIKAAALLVHGQEVYAALGTQRGWLKVYRFSRADIETSRTVKLLDFEPEIDSGAFHFSEIYSLDFAAPPKAPRQKYLVSTSRDGRACILDFSADKNKPLTTPSHIYAQGEKIDRWGIAISPDASDVALGGYDPNLAIVELSYQNVSFWYDTLSWHPLGHDIAVGSAGAAGLEILSHPFEEPGIKGLGHPGGIRSLAWSPDGQWLASGGDEDFTIRLWSRELDQPAEDKKRFILSGFEVQPDMVEGAINNITWVNDQSLLATCLKPPLFIKIKKPKDERTDNFTIYQSATPLNVHVSELPAPALALKPLSLNKVILIDDTGKLQLIEI